MVTGATQVGGFEEVPGADRVLEVEVRGARVDSDARLSATVPELRRPRTSI